MFSARCFKENCQNKLVAKCDCEENALFCQDHAFGHLSKPSSKRHLLIQLYFKPAEEIKQPIVQKLIELKKEIQIFRIKAIANAHEAINSFKASFGKYLDQISEVDKKCCKMIEGLLKEEEFLDIAAEDDMESVLKLDLHKAKIKMLGWNPNCCYYPDYKEIKAAINNTHEVPFNPFTPFGGIVEDEVESSELSFFRHSTSDFSTINLDNFQVSSTTALTIQEKISYITAPCTLPDKTYFYCCNALGSSGMVFTIDKNKNVKQLQKSKVNAHLDPIYYDSFIYLIGGGNKLAERYGFNQNLWQSLAPLDQSLDFSCSCSALYGDSILISGYSLQKVICYRIAQNNYKDIPHLTLDSKCHKFMLRGNNRIYLFERGKRTFESSENDVSNWVHIGTNGIGNDYYRQSAVVRYKGILYFINYNSKLWKFDLSSKQLSEVKAV